MPGDPHPLAFTIHSTTADFANWLVWHTTCWDDRILDLGDGTVAVLSPFQKCVVARRKWAWCQWDIGALVWYLGTSREERLPDGTVKSSGTARLMPPLAVVAAQDKGNGEIEVHMDCSGLQACPPFISVFVGLLREIADAWDSSQRPIDFYLKALGIEGPAAEREQAVPSGGNGKKLPKGKGVTLPDYKESLPRAYGQYVKEKGVRPTTAELADALSVNKSTVDRRIRDIRKQGGTWPPSLE